MKKLWYNFWTILKFENLFSYVSVEKLLSSFQVQRTSSRMPCTTLTTTFSWNILSPEHVVAMFTSDLRRLLSHWKRCNKRERKAFLLHFMLDENYLTVDFSGVRLEKDSLELDLPKYVNWSEFISEVNGIWKLYKALMWLKACRKFSAP